MRGVLAAALMLAILTQPGPRAQTERYRHASGTSPERGTLRVWIVSPLQTAKPLVLPQTVQQQTSGSFGQDAGGFGQTAGGYGQTAGDFGKTAGSTGKTAGETGQTAGSFGNSVDTLAAAAAAADPGNQANKLPPTKASRDPKWSALLSDLQRTFPGLNIRLEDVSVADLHRRLQATAKGEWPDLFVGLGTDERTLTLQPVGLAGWVASEAPTQVAIFRDAPDRRAAEAVYVWLLDRALCLECGEPNLGAETAAAVEVARSALKAELAGAMPAPADPEMADFNQPYAQASAFSPSSASDVDQRMLTEVTSARANAVLGVVSLRTLAEGKGVFGVMHSVVVLRKVDGAWHVLQVTPLVPRINPPSAGMLGPFQAVHDPPGPLPAISQAAPPDGDNRQVRPELWWDNNGLARVQVVESQFRVQGGWSNSSMMMVDDTEPRPRVQVTAKFAAAVGEYRWRVWSVGADGLMSITPWSRLNIH